MKKNDRFLLKISKGYTLLELLVVIGLITILMSFGAASYSTAQKKARDSKRKSDLKVLQNALEQYYSVCQYSYPLPHAADQTSADPYFASVATIGTCDTGVRPILSGLLDPMGKKYICLNCTASSFTICPPRIGTTTDLLEASTCTISGKECCLSNQQ